MIRTLIAAAAVAASAFALSAPAYADTAPTARVSYADLDLSRESDAQAMYARLQQAARDVCAPVGHGRRGLAARAAVRECRADVVAQSVSSLNAPLVTAFFYEGTGREPARIAVAQR
jgi:UrcA family protein